MRFGKGEVVIAALVVLTFAIGIYFYPQMPERVASHWNAQGQADGYMSKFWGIFLVPFISLGLSVLLLFIPRIDPQKKNVEAFKKYYIGFIVVLLLFMLYIYVLTILWNLDTRFNFIQLLVPAFAAISYSAGVLLQKAKRNYFIGIRTPWTLSSDRVWERTHSIGGKLFKAAGIVSLLGIFFQNYAIFFILVPLFTVVVFTIVYSYVDYQKETRQQIK